MLFSLAQLFLVAFSLLTVVATVNTQNNTINILGRTVRTNKRSLIINNGEKSGTLPPEISLLSDLTILRISESPLEGTVPTEIGTLTKLAELRLKSTNVTGGIPTQIGCLTQLIDLDLSSQNLTGTIPTQIGHLVNLHARLDLSRQDITGTIPTQIGLLVNLVYIDLSNSHLVGTIPTELGKLTDLLELKLQYSRLNGTLAPQLGGMGQLKRLDLAVNGIYGTFPRELSHFASLVDLTLARTLICGDVARLPKRVLGVINIDDTLMTSSDPEDCPAALKHCRGTLISDCDKCEDITFRLQVRVVGGSANVTVGDTVVFQVMADNRLEFELWVSGRKATVNGPPFGHGPLTSWPLAYNFSYADTAGEQNITTTFVTGPGAPGCSYEGTWDGSSVFFDRPFDECHPVSPETVKYLDQPIFLGGIVFGGLVVLAAVVLGFSLVRHRTKEKTKWKIQFWTDMGLVCCSGVNAVSVVVGVGVRLRRFEDCVLRRALFTWSPLVTVHSVLIGITLLTAKNLNPVILFVRASFLLSAANIAASTWVFASLEPPIMFVDQDRVWSCQYSNMLEIIEVGVFAVYVIVFLVTLSFNPKNPGTPLLEREEPSPVPVGTKKTRATVLLGLVLASAVAMSGQYWSNPNIRFVVAAFPFLTVSLLFLVLRLFGLWKVAKKEKDREDSNVVPPL